MHLSMILGTAVLLGTTISAQGLNDHILYYKFNAGAGDAVVNYGGATGAPGDGMIMRGPAAFPSWQPGRFGFGLSGSDASSSSNFNYVTTDWAGPHTSSFTLAWFQKQHGAAAPSSLSYIISGLGSFRLFTGGVANKGLWLRAWGGQPSDLKLATDVQAASANAWVHIALVVDTTANTATWYVDGVAQPAIPLTSSTVNFGSATTTMKVGKHTSDSSTYGYDIDEFRFLNRAAAAAEVKNWSGLSSAADGMYGKGCGAKLASSNGPPKLNTPTYQLNLSGSASSAFVLSIGSSRTAINFDLGVLDAKLKGCQWESNLIAVLPGATDGSGNATIPLPIPQDPALVGLQLYNQGLVVPAPSAPLESTNGLAISVHRL